MTTAVANAGALPSPRSGAFVLGRTFLHPMFDYMLIGGGVSLLFTAVLAVRYSPTAAVVTMLPAIMLLCNAAHFGASTVRLYTRQGALRNDPFLTMALPLVMAVLIALGVTFPEAIGFQVTALVFIWSPYHFAAQTYGLAVMYCYRSSAPLSDREKSLLRGVCLLPFVVSFVSAPYGGLGWLISPLTIDQDVVLRTSLEWVLIVLKTATLLSPLALAVHFRRLGKRLPAISVLAVVANGIWWVVLPYLNALVWSNVFHAVQYLAVVTIFHVNEQVKRPGNRRPAIVHALIFYTLSAALGYSLFHVLPFGFEAAGFGWAASAILVVAALNLHHFIVDAYIWRLRRDPNYKVVVSEA